MSPFRNALRALVVAALFCCLSSSAFAQLRAGAYGVQGQNPDGSAYEGDFELREGPNAAWVARWQVGDAEIIGLGLIQGGLLALSFTVNNRPGIAVYGVEPDGTLRGSWTTGGGLGTETLTPH